MKGCLETSPIGDCSGGAHGSIGNWDVSGVTDMSDMFVDHVGHHAFLKFNQDLSKWDVSAVTNMEYMFASAHDFNQDLSKWDVSAVTNMQSMFADAPAFNQDLSKWDVSAVTNMKSMFQWASSFNQDLSKWDVSAVTNMESMFFHASAFQYKLCGVAWVHSKAGKMDMFSGSKGAISRTVCPTAKPGMVLEITFCVRALWLGVMVMVRIIRP